MLWLLAPVPRGRRIRNEAMPRTMIARMTIRSAGLRWVSLGVVSWAAMFVRCNTARCGAFAEVATCHGERMIV